MQFGWEEIKKPVVMELSKNKLQDILIKFSQYIYYLEFLIKEFRSDNKEGDDDFVDPRKNQIIIIN